MIVEPASEPKRSPNPERSQKRPLASRVLRAARDLIWHRRSSVAAYVAEAPSPQVALDIFKGEWSSRVPVPGFGEGAADLFADQRISSFIDAIGGVTGRRVLELGPLEGGHTYMLEKAGAEEIIAVEANTRAYLKCLVVKETLGLKKAHYLCGDFVEYLRQATTSHDVIVASGVLYHMRNPIELIDLLARRCTGSLFLWTHYFDEKRAARLSRAFPGDWVASQHGGFSCRLRRYEYRHALNWAGFCGGPLPYSHWMAREDVLAALRYFGFERISVVSDDRDHPHSPALTLIAQK